VSDGNETRDFDELTVFERTETGDAALVSPPPGLDRASLRLLTLIDGQRSLADLPRFARAGELDRLVEILRKRGLVELRGKAAQPDALARRQRLAEERAMLDQIKRELRGVFERELGHAGHVWEARVQDCVSIQVLRQVLREAIDVLYFRGGGEPARRVVALVKPLFRQSER
jgi:hypothetical protein